jgi:hypothetical protein
MASYEYMEKAVKDMLKGLYEAPPIEDAAYTPALVVGLGGAGIKVLRTVKKCFQNYNVQHVKLLGIDCDDGENRIPGLPELADSELCILKPEVAVGALDRADEGFPDCKYIDDFLPDSFENYTGIRQAVRAKIQAGQGAGQFRRAGKLLFGANVNNGARLNNVFNKLKTELIGQHTKLEQGGLGKKTSSGMKIYVVSSIAGGTGAGILLETIALLRSHFRGATDTISAFLLLPGDALDKELRNPLKETPNTRGNAIGVIRELQPMLLAEIKHNFVFDKDSQFKYDGKNTLLNNCYLIDNKLMDHTPIETWMDMCQATGYFLYSLVGTGTGASEASGAVNFEIREPSERAAIPRVFSTLGVGVVEYPVYEIGCFSLQKILDNLLERLFNPTKEEKDADTEVAKIMSLPGLQDLDSLKAKMDFVAGALEDVCFLQGEQSKKLALKEFDPVFIGAADKKLACIDGDLNAYNERLEQKAQEIIDEVCNAADEHARKLVTGSHAVAKAKFETLKSSVAKLNDKLRDEQEKRKIEFTDLKSELEQLKKTIGFWDCYLDTALRKKLIMLVNKYISYRVEDKLGQCLDKILTAILVKLNNLGSQIACVSLEMESLQRLNRQRLDSGIYSDPRRRFIQSAWSPSELESWLNSLKLKPAPCFVASELSRDIILWEALKGSLPGLISELEGLNLIDDAEKNPSIKKRIKTLNLSSQPLMDFVKTRPDENQMEPQMFVAGNVEENDPFLNEENFPKVGSQDVIGIQTGNQHMVICMRILQGFGIAHWAEYQRALKYYKEKEWYFHTFPASEKLPPLETVSSERRDQLQIFGLSMMFDFITKRGSNYYRNMLQSGDDRKYYYLTFKKETGRFSQKLIEHNLVFSAKESELRPRADNLIANSLESAVETLGKPEWGALCKEIQDLVEDFISSFGKVGSQKLIKEFVAEELVGEMKKTQSNTERRDILNEIADALGKYADNIG